LFGGRIRMSLKSRPDGLDQKLILMRQQKIYVNFDSSETISPKVYEYMTLNQNLIFFPNLQKIDRGFHVKIKEMEIHNNIGRKQKRLEKLGQSESVSFKKLTYPRFFRKTQV
jgi:hypothetical protein